MAAAIPLAHAGKRINDGYAARRQIYAKPVPHPDYSPDNASPQMRSVLLMYAFALHSYSLFLVGKKQIPKVLSTGQLYPYN